MLKKPMDRRTFLTLVGKTSAIVIGVSLLPGCTRGGSVINPEENEQNFYVRNQDKIMQEVDEFAGCVRKVCTNKYGEEMADQLIDETIQSFQVLLPDLPFIGGYTNDLTANLYQSAAGLAFYRAMLAHHKTLEETGEVLFRATEIQASSIPLGGMAASMSTSQSSKEKYAAAAKASQEKKYEANWVFNYIEGDGKEFDYGIDYSECGICKYYQAQGAEELTPYMCLLDYPISAALNTGLVRTSTIGRGGSCCDFRYKVGRPVQMDWTPSFLK